MKNTFKYIVTFVALLSGLAVYAQNLDEGTYKEENGIAYAKRAIVNDDGTYTIDLETFVTGAVTQTFEVHPADIVLVLDVSGSMDDPIKEHVYTPTTVNSIQASSYYYYGGLYNNTSVQTDWYFKYENEYYRVSVGRGGTNNNPRFFLFFTVNNVRHYINTDGQVVTTEPTNATGWYTNLKASSVQFYTHALVNSDTKKIEALRAAVKAFISQIEHNDFYEDDTDDKPRLDENNNPAPLGNRISIVKFAGNTYYKDGNTTQTANTDEGNNYYTSGQYTYNATQVVKSFRSTSDPDNVTELNNAVDALTAAGATSADYGMNLAHMLISGIGSDRSDSRKTVVFFTDGEPNHNRDFDNGVATDAIVNSGKIKAITYTETYEEGGEQKTRTVHPSVFSVGVFDDTPTPNGNLDNFMNYISSNYPNASAYNNGGTKASSDYYMDASGGSAEDLKKIFAAIAHSAGGSGNADVSGGSTLTVDVVSSSFSVPKGVSPSTAVTVKVAPCTGKTTINGKEYLTFGPEGTPQSYGLGAITPNIVEADNKVTTTGFDYSANWCGPDPTNTTSTIQPGYHGFKQIIRFTITVNEDAVGGPAVETNDPNSGIYLPGATKPLIKFNRPNVKLPVQIWIQKQGLKGDESAVFNLRRIEYRGTYETDENGDYKLDADGKPIRIKYEDIAKDEWENFTKVVINNQDMDDNGMVKVVGLDPDYVYRLDEDAWAFGYTYQDGGIQYTVGDNIENPFIFVNKPKNKKFDEASARNVFKEKKPASK